VELEDGRPKARKVPKGQVSWERAKDRKSSRERSDGTKDVKEDEGPVTPEWMKAKKIILTFLLIFIILTVLALLVEPLRYIFPLVGIVIMIAAYFFGGGMSEWHSAPHDTTHGARSMLKYRYDESASNWDTITAGFIIGGLIFLSGVVAILTDAFF
jgi:hypothetical protein